jgi:hypothetical protein
MDDRPDELFLIDVDQEAKELAQYGAGAAELSSERLTASLHYVASLLVSLELHAHASFASSFARAARRMEEGDARRTARDFADSLRRRIEAIRTDNQDDSTDFDLPESLWDRLPQTYRAGIAGKQATDASGDLPVRQVPSAAVFEDAAKALAAADEFAALLRTRASLQRDVPTRADLGSIEGLSGEISSNVDSQGGDVPGASAIRDGHMGPSALNEAVPDANGLSEGVTGEIAPSEDTRVGFSDQGQRLLSVEKPLSPTLSAAQVDECFRRAVRVAEGDLERWPTGMQALFDAIDELDRVRLQDAFPAQIQLLAGADASISHSLAQALVLALEQACPNHKLEGLAEAMVVSHTLILSLQLTEPLLTSVMARFAANFSGRIESSLADKRIRLILPASRRLLRIVPLRLGEDWFAVPWAQFIGMEDSAFGGSRSVAVSLGNTPDRIRVDEVGLVSVGVWYELPKPLRHRDRYRGVALVSRGNPLPVFG